MIITQGKGVMANKTRGGEVNVFPQVEQTTGVNVSNYFQMALDHRKNIRTEH